MLPNCSFAISRGTGIRIPLEWTGQSPQRFRDGAESQVVQFCADIVL